MKGEDLIGIGDEIATLGQKISDLGSLLGTDGKPDEKDIGEVTDALNSIEKESEELWGLVNYANLFFEDPDVYHENRQEARAQEELARCEEFLSRQGE
tara:strand:+ start:449 stop:742 length:294 start_codon:yes stop_codon:yes gene_type:complete